MGVELREGRVSGVPFSQCGLGIHVLHTTCMSIDGVVTCGGSSLWLRPVGRPPPSRACCVGQARSAQRTPRRVSPRRPFCCHGVRSLAAARSTVQTCCIMEAIPEKRIPGARARRARMHCANCVALVAAANTHSLAKAAALPTLPACSTFLPG